MSFFKYMACICSAAVTSVCILTLILFFSGIYPYIVLSGSMEPAISTGSLVFVQTRELFIETGDVILYETDAGNVTHRVAEYTAGQYITKGDANKTHDPAPVKEEQIKGKVIFDIPGLGYGVLFLRTPQGICLLLLILFLSIILKFHVKVKMMLKSKGA